MKSLKTILATATAAISLNAVDVFAANVLAENITAENIPAQDAENTTLGIHTAVVQFGNDAPIEIAVQGIEECPGIPSVNAVRFNETVTTVCYDSNNTGVYSGVCVPNGTTAPDCDNHFPARKEQLSALTLQP